MPLQISIFQYVFATLMVCTLFPSQSVAQTKWWQDSKVAKTKHYALKTDLPADQAKVLARHMDATYDSYVRTFSKLPVRVRTTATLGLFLFADQQDYLTTLPVHFRANGTGSWGMCISRGKTISLVGYRGDHTVEQMKPLLQHEGFHQFARYLFPDLPPWANEGLAEVFERGVAVSNRLVLGDIHPSDRQRLLKAIDSGEAIPIVDLLNIDSKQWSQHVQSSQAGLQYLQAWSLVQYFLFAEGGRHQKKFLGFLVQLNSDVDWEKSFISTFGWVDWNELQRRWEAYVKRVPATDLRQDVRSVDYLAAGMKELRAAKIYPSETEMLRAALIEREFKRSTKLYAKETTLDSNNTLMQQLGSSETSQPDAPSPKVRLVFSDARGRKPSRSYKTKKSPKPLNIHTVGMKPRDLKIEWKRKGKDYIYEIIPK